ncbi:hypothetical protein BD769DRAFT_1510913, partial [Suillus cothurnatus]
MVATVHCKASEYHLSVPRDLLTSRITLLFEYSTYFTIVVITLLSNYLIMISITLLSNPNHYLIITIVLLLFYWY